VNAFANAIERLRQLPFEPARAVAHAETFSVTAFQTRIAAAVQEALAAGPARRG
jgi:hypothetical protein